MKRYAILCPGQGSQHVASFSLVAHEAAAQPVLEAASATLGMDPLVLVSDASAACDNHNAQVLVAAASLSAWRAVGTALPSPALIAGYSVGEVTAYGCANSLSLTALFALIKQRAALTSAVAPEGSGLLTVRGGNAGMIAQLCAAAGAHVAIINAPDRHVIGGDGAALDRFEAEAASRPLQCTRLPVRIPAHTPLLRAAAESFRQVLEASDLRGPQQPVLAGIDGREIVDRGAAIDALARQLAAPIDWHGCMTRLMERGCRVFLELPPGRALSQMLREQFAGIEARAVEDFRTLQGASTWLRARL